MIKSSYTSQQAASAILANFGMQGAASVLEKGISPLAVADAIQYGQNKIDFAKTGEEIYDKLEIKKNEIDALKSVKLQEIGLALKECDCLPTESIPSWRLRYDISPYDELKVFSSDKCYPKSSSGVTGQTFYPSESIKVDDGRNCYQLYNDCVYEYIELVNACYLLETFMKNLDVAQTYELSLTQLTAFGF